jgi:hypothetical protein
MVIMHVLNIITSGVRSCLRLPRRETRHVLFPVKLLIFFWSVVLCSLVRQVPFENERPLACWEEDDLGISICLAPVLVCAEASPFLY